MNNANTPKQQFFERLGAVADEMIEAHGKEFALGALILTARFVAEGKGLDDTQNVILTGETHGTVAT